MTFKLILSVSRSSTVYKNMLGQVLAPCQQLTKFLNLYSIFIFHCKSGYSQVKRQRKWTCIGKFLMIYYNNLYFKLARRRFSDKSFELFLEVPMITHKQESVFCTRP